MKELIEGIAKALVDNPDEVVVEEIVDGKDILLKLKVADSEMGKVIGKKGRIAKSMRTVLKSVSNKKKVNVTLEIVEDWALPSPFWFLNENAILYRILAVV